VRSIRKRSSNAIVIAIENFLLEQLGRLKIYHQGSIEIFQARSGYFFSGRVWLNISEQGAIEE
jgi:hypothetical protein